jgi:hypothetical protein
MRGEWIREPAGDACVVFVHGVLSDGEACWTSANGTNWPGLLRDDTQVEGLGIYVFTYRTGVFSGAYHII